MKSQNNNLLQQQSEMRTIVGDTRPTNKVVISGFSDEVSASKNLDQQFTALKSLGMEFFSIRFVLVDGQVKNTVDLTDVELEGVKSKIDEYGLSVSSLGSPIGKVKLLDVEDDSNNQFLPLEKYLSVNMSRACEVACQLETKLIRGFSFYHPRESDVRTHLNQAIDQIGRLVETADRFGMVFGLEVEANLVGHTGQLLAEIYSAINHPALVLIFDGANLVTQGYDGDQVFEQYLAMKPGLGWLHIKDYQPDLAMQNSTSKVGGYVDEDSLRCFVPVENGESDYWRVFQDLCHHGDAVFERSRELGLPGLFMDLEPHLKGGGQFGGYSDADGFGLAFRSLCRLLDQSGLEYQLRDLNSVKATMS